MAPSLRKRKLMMAMMLEDADDEEEVLLLTLLARMDSDVPFEEEKLTPLGYAEMCAKYNDADFYSFFRFTKKQIPRLAMALRMPRIRCPVTRVVAEHMDALLYLPRCAARAAPPEPPEPPARTTPRAPRRATHSAAPPPRRDGPLRALADDGGDIPGSIMGNLRGARAATSAAHRRTCAGAAAPRCRCVTSHRGPKRARRGRRAHIPGRRARATAGARALRADARAPRLRAHCGLTRARIAG